MAGNAVHRHGATETWFKRNIYEELQRLWKRPEETRNIQRNVTGK